MRWVEGWRVRIVGEVGWLGGIGCWGLDRGVNEGRVDVVGVGDGEGIGW